MPIKTAFIYHRANVFLKSPLVSCLNITGDPLSSDKVLQASNDLVFVALNSSLSNDGVKLQIDNLRSIG